MSETNKIIEQFLESGKLGSLFLGQEREAVLVSVWDLVHGHSVNDFQVFHHEDLTVIFDHNRLVSINLSLGEASIRLPRSISSDEIYEFPKSRCDLLRFAETRGILYLPHYNSFGEEVGLRLSSNVISSIEGERLLSLTIETLLSDKIGG